MKRHGVIAVGIVLCGFCMASAAAAATDLARS